MRGERGLTMLELLVVVSIIGVLAATVSIRVMNFVGGRSAPLAYKADEQTIQPAVATFQHSDVHGGWVDATPSLWGCNDTAVAEATGHYYPTSIARVRGHILTLSGNVTDENDNPRIDGASDAATSDEIDAHAIWMGLLVNGSGDYESATGTTDRGVVSVLKAEACLYLLEIPESASTTNGALAPGGTYTWVVSEDGQIFGAYRGEDGKWYAGFNGVFP